MPSTGAVFFGTGANNADAGNDAWGNTGNISASDNTRATTTDFAAVGDTTQYLHGTMGANAHAIPSDATVDGITVGWEYAEGSGASNNAIEHTIQAIKAGSRVGDNKSTGASAPKTGGEVRVAYGGAADLWGTTWTPAQVNATDFGAAFRGECQAFATAFNMLMDAGDTTIQYTEAAAGGQPTWKRWGGVPRMGGRRSALGMTVH